MLMSVARLAPGPVATGAKASTPTTTTHAPLFTPGWVPVPIRHHTEHNKLGWPYAAWPSLGVRTSSY
jgi:hypothetical protein